MISSMIQPMISGMVSGVIAGSSSQFSPLDLSPALWLDASDTATITHVANAVSQWSDKSGNANHVTQAVALQQPSTNTRTLNGLNVIDYTTTPAYKQLLIPSALYPITSGASTLFIVCNRDNGSLDRSYYEIIGTGGTYRFSMSNAISRDHRFLHGSTNLDYQVAALDTAARIATCTRNGTSLTSYKNGGTPVTSTSGANITAPYTSGTMGSTFGTDGFYAEIIHYNSLLSSVDINRVGEYLAEKWGITWVNF